jgi:hypothetical protein
MKLPMICRVRISAVKPDTALPARNVHPAEHVFENGQHALDARCFTKSQQNDREQLGTDLPVRMEMPSPGYLYRSRRPERHIAETRQLD